MLPEPHLTHPGKAFLEPKRASEFLAVQGFTIAPKTLAKLRCIGGGPNFLRFGRRILYDPNHLMTWALSKTSPSLSNTSEA
jgi:hypothetical protein